MIKRFSAAFAAFLIAISMSACGTISPPQAAETTTTTTTIPETTTVPTTTVPQIDESSVAENDSSELTEKEKDQIEQNTFIAEFFESEINFEDTKDITEEPLKTAAFEHESVKNGIEKISLKSKNGSGNIDVMVIDISKSELGYDLEYTLGTFGDYYFEYTKNSVQGLNDEDFVSNYRMINSVVSKGKYQRYGSVQKTDGMASQFGYAETFAVLKDNKLTVISGEFLSADMMERQQFSTLLRGLTDKVAY